MHAKATVNRIAAFDNMKGILIFLVVFAHILKNKSEFAPVVFGIYFFHMPAFIVISGCLSRKGKTEKDKAYSQAKLLLIYFVFNGVLMILFGRSNPNAIKPYYVMWYILCLVTWRLTSEKLSAIPNIMVVLVFAGLCCGIWKSIDNTFALSRMIAFFPFFMIGFIYKDAIIKLTLRKNGKEIIIGCIALLLAGIFGILSYHVFAFKIDDFTMEPYQDSAGVFKRIAFYLVGSLAIVALGILTPNKTLPLITAFGRNSLGIYLFHRPITKYVARYFLKSTEMPVSLLIALFSSLLICFLFGTQWVNTALDQYFNTVTDVVTGRRKAESRIQQLVMVSFLAFTFFIILFPVIANCLHNYF